MNATPASLGVSAQIGLSPGMLGSGGADVGNAAGLPPWLGKLWAKSPDAGGHGWHPLIFHMLDFATAADGVANRLCALPEAAAGRPIQAVDGRWRYGAKGASARASCAEFFSRLTGAGRTVGVCAFIRIVLTNFGGLWL